MTPEELELLTNHISTNVLKIINQHQHSPDSIIQTIQAVQMGLGNVYSEFKILEKRQIEIEILLKQPHLVNYLNVERFDKFLKDLVLIATPEFVDKFYTIKKEIRNLADILGY